MEEKTNAQNVRNKGGSAAGDHALEPLRVLSSNVKRIRPYGLQIHRSSWRYALGTPPRHSLRSDAAHGRDGDGAAQAVDDDIRVHPHMEPYLHPKRNHASIPTCKACKMSSFGKRLNSALDHRGLNPSDLARRLGVSAQAIYSIQAGRTKSMTAANSARAAEALGISAHWLATGEGSMLEPPENSARPLPPAHPTSPIRASTKDPAKQAGTLNVEYASAIRSEGVPLISWVQAGEFCEAIDNFQPGDAEERIPTTASHGPRAYALRVRGDSMLHPGGEDSFRDGDIILVDPDREPRHRSMVIVRMPETNEVTFKQLLVDGAQRHLQALNPQWPDRVLPLPADAVICGVVFMLSRSYA